VKRTVAFIVASLAVLSAFPQPAAAQESRVPLKIDLVVSRTAGDKKVSSMPYTLWVTANEQRIRTSLRMGVQVPVASTRITENKDTVPSYTYRDVGMNIDCSATTLADGRFYVTVTLNDSSINVDTKDTRGAVPGLPVFRNFSSNFALVLKDGQHATYTSATDPVSGEVTKIDVTLSVLK